MIIAYSYMPVIEEILITRLEEYLMSDCKWASLYPNFPKIKISNEYPWVDYMVSSDSITYFDLTKVSEDLFPAVTITTTNDSKSPQMFVDLRPVTMVAANLSDFIERSEEDGYLISPTALTAVETHFDTYDILYGTNCIYQKRDTVTIDITVDDFSNVKNRLYDLISLYLLGEGAAQLKNDLEIGIIHHTVSGNRSGAYNIEFGRTLRGASIQFDVDYKIEQVFYDTEAVDIASVSIDHTVSVLGE